MHQKKSETYEMDDSDGEYPTETDSTTTNMCNTVNHCLEQICLSDKFSDVVFIFSNSPTKLPAHRVILSMRSDVFGTMFYGQMAKTDREVLLEDDTPEIFDIVLRYVYTDEVSLDGDTVLRCLYAAKKYCLDGLVEECTSFLTQSISTENVCMVYDQADLYDHKDLKDQCFNIITQYAKDVFATKGFLRVSRDTLQHIVASDDLQCEEETVFHAVLKWAEYHCDTAKVTQYAKEIRDVLGDILYHVRFPLMELDTFARVVSPSGLLTNEEQVLLYQYFATQGSLPITSLPVKFCTKKRR